MSSEHTVRAYDEELEALTAELSRMGGLAEAEVADVDPRHRPARRARWPRR